MNGSWKSCKCKILFPFYIFCASILPARRLVTFRQNDTLTGIKLFRFNFYQMTENIFKYFNFKFKFKRNLSFLKTIN